MRMLAKSPPRWWAIITSDSMSQSRSSGANAERRRIRERLETVFAEETAARGVVVGDRCAAVPHFPEMRIAFRCFSLVPS